MDENEDFQSKDPFNRDPFELNTAATTTSDGIGFNSIIGNNNISNNSMVYGYHTNGAYDQSNDFLMNFYASQCTNYSPFTANTNCNNTNIHQPHNSSYSNALNSCSSSYNPFHQHFCVLTSSANASTNNSRHNDVDDINSNNDNWANFDSSLDNFADFDSHFTSMTPATFSLIDSANSTLEDDEEIPATTSDSYANDDEEEVPCFIATTQVLEISSVPPQHT